MVSTRSVPFFFKNTIQLQFNSTFHKVKDQDQLCFKRYLTNVAIFETPKMQLPAFYFEIGVVLLSNDTL